MDKKIDKEVEKKEAGKPKYLHWKNTSLFAQTYKHCVGAS